MQEERTMVRAVDAGDFQRRASNLANELGL